MKKNYTIALKLHKSFDLNVEGKTKWYYISVSSEY